METTAQLPHRQGANWITQSHRYTNHAARDGREALKVAAQYRPELIFLDIAMPELNGYEVCQRLRNIPVFADARIYAMSAFTGEPHETRCAEAGFTGRLSKPIDPQAIERLTH